MRGALSGILCALAVTATAQEFTTLKGHGGPVMGLTVNPGGQVASASFDNSVGLWDDATPQWLEGHDAAVIALAFGQDGTLYSGGDDFTVRRWGADPATLGQHLGKVTSLAPLPDGTGVVSGSWDGSIRVWPGGTALSTPGAGVSALGFDAAGQLYAATSTGRLLRYPTLDSTPEPMARHGFGINVLTVAEEWIAYGAVDGSVRVLDLKTGATLADLSLEQRPILSIAHHSASNRLMAGDGRGFVMVVDTARWRITRLARVTRDGPVWALAFSPDGETLYTGGLDSAVYAWPVALLNDIEPAPDKDQPFLRPPGAMPNGERQFNRKCSICHALTEGPSRQAGPTLYGLFGRRAGTVPGYLYSSTLQGSDIVWTEETVNALFDEGPDHYIPGSKMPMQVIRGAQDRADLVTYLKSATETEAPQ